MAQNQRIQAAESEKVSIIMDLSQLSVRLENAGVTFAPLAMAAPKWTFV